MHAPALLVHHVLAGVLASSGTAKPKASSGSSIFFILIVVMIGVYFVWLRPQRRRQQAAAAAQRQADVGDEVVTAAGIYGRVVAMDGDRVSVEISPGTVVEVARRALGQRVDPLVADPDVPEEPGTGFGQPGYDGHDDLDDEPPAATDHEDEGEDEEGGAGPRGGTP
ncbi:MAG: preprotein translocase subunit YajC [Actinomycetota bacterium]|nr:preprotein translocase subunit YajC [Actinomycetota bacterium]